MSQASKRKLDRRLAAEAKAASETSFFTIKNIALIAGAAIVVPYLVRRLWPMISGDVVNVSAKDVVQAGKDSVRDAADDLNVGGLQGKVQRGVGRVADRVNSQI